MTDRHDLAEIPRGGRPGVDLKLRRQRGRIDDETVIPRGLDRMRGDAGEQSPPRVLDLIDLAVHQPVGPHDPAAEDLTDRLMAEADPENRHPASKPPHGITGDTRLVGRARAG